MAPFPAVGHVGLTVTDLDRSATFYRRIFGLQLVGKGGGGDHPPYCFLGWDGRVVVTLWQQGDVPFAGGSAGLHHLCFLVESIAEVEAFERRLGDAGGTPLHGGIVPHAEGLDSGGLFFLDPDGIRLEVSTTAGAGKRPAPIPGAPTCGFF